jgi:hypothetical protein
LLWLGLKFAVPGENKLTHAEKTGTKSSPQNRIVQT